METPVGTRGTPVGYVFDEVPLTSQHWKAGFALFFAFVIEAWELLIIVYASGLIAADFGLNTTQVGGLISAIFLGMIPGALIWGTIADRIGRRRVVIWSLAAYGVIALVSAFSISYAMLYGLRFVAGLAISGAFVVTFPYFEELLPTDERGRFTVYLASGWPFGVLLAVGTTLLLTPLGWRWILGASALAGLWCLVVARWVPESPYWLAGKGRTEEARAVIHRLSEDKIRVDQDLYVEEHNEGSVAEIFGRDYRVLTIVQILLNFCFSWGYWGLQTWLPTLLQNRGFDVTQSLGFVAISAVFMIPGYITASFLTHRYGRKWVFIAFVFGSANTLVVLYIGSFMLSFFSLGAWGVWDTWLGELYASKIRAVGYSWGILAQRVANTVAPVVVGFLLARATSFTTTVLFINTFLVATALLALYFREMEGEELA
jgi:MFS transporter, putative metabolite:H+ symporter